MVTCGVLAGMRIISVGSLGGIDLTSYRTMNWRSTMDLSNFNQSPAYYYYYFYSFLSLHSSTQCGIRLTTDRVVTCILVTL